MPPSSSRSPSLVAAASVDARLAAALARADAADERTRVLEQQLTLQRAQLDEKDSQLRSLLRLVAASDALLSRCRDEIVVDDGDRASHPGDNDGNDNNDNANDNNANCNANANDNNDDVQQR